MSVEAFAGQKTLIAGSVIKVLLNYWKRWYKGLVTFFLQ